MVNLRARIDSKPLIACIALLALTGCPPEEPSDENNTTTTPMPENGKPVAIVGENQVAFVGDTVEVSAAASDDPDGDALTVTWSIEGPAGSEATLDDPSAFRTTFVPDVAGDYTLEVVVSDGKDSDTNRVYVRVRDRTISPNEAPVADAGMDGTYLLEQAITLDGSNSSDPDGDALTFRWTILTLPDGSGASIADVRSETTELIADLPGEYVIELVVDDGAASSAPDTIAINVERATPMNTAPVAVAGDDIVANAGELVTLDGTGSYDDDGDPLTYQWAITSQPGESAISLDDPTLAAPSFTPDVGGRYTFALTVNDGIEFSAIDELNVDILSETNNPPVAVAPPGGTIRLGQPHQLDGTASYDDDGDTLSYQWTLMNKPAGSVVLLDGAATATPTLTPDVAGDYEIMLVVNDGTFSSDPATVTLQAALIETPCLRFSEYIEGSANNKAFEITNCGSTEVDLSTIKVCVVPNSSQVCGSTEALSGTLAPGGFLVFCHTQLDGSVADLSKCDYSSTAANYNGNDRLLIFDDPDGDGDPNSPQDVADAFGETASEPGGDPWEDVTLRRCDDTRYDGTGTFDISRFKDIMTLDDFSNLGLATSAADCSNMMVNSPPVANPGSARAAVTGNLVQLDGSNSSDADMDMLTYQWTLTSSPMGSAAMLMDATTATPSFTPDVDGVYEVELVVSDGMDSSAPATITITAGTSPSITGDCFKISEYIEGASNNKAIELYNCGSTTLDISNVKLCVINNNSTSCSTSLQLSGMSAPGDVIGVCNGQLDQTRVDATDCTYTSGATNFNGDDRLLLFQDPDGDGQPNMESEILDAFGETMAPPMGGKIWEDLTLRRCDFATQYTGTGAFDYLTYYDDSAPADDFSSFGDPPATCATTP